MAFIDLHYFSEALGMQTSVWVIIPQKSNAGEIGAADAAGGDGRYKCLYLLHGCSDDQTIWLRRTSIERYAAEYDLCVVMPFAARSYYTDMVYGEKYYTFVAKELPKVIREFLPVSAKREDNYVAGLSMGGYGALKIALRERDSFCMGAGLSSVVDMQRRTEWNMFRNIFGDPAMIPADCDLLALADAARNDEKKPRLFMACGTEDSLYPENAAFAGHLLADGYDITFMESAGDHEWAFWNEYILKVLHWMFPGRPVPKP